MTDAPGSASTPPAGPVLAADGTPLKKSLQRALRAQKLRALALVAPLLIFVLMSFLFPIGDMLFRSVENQIVPNTMPQTVRELRGWEGAGDELPPESTFDALYYDLFLAAEAKQHTRLGTRLNYEKPGLSSLFRSTGRSLDDVGEQYQDVFEELDPRWEEAGFWFELMTGGSDAEPDNTELLAARERLEKLTSDDMSGEVGFVPGAAISQVLPRTVREYAAFALFTAIEDEDVVAEEEPWEAVYLALGQDMQDPTLAPGISAYAGPGSDALAAALENVDSLPRVEMSATFAEIDSDWSSAANWETINLYSGNYTNGYLLNAVDMKKTVDGPELKPESQRIYLKLFWRTMLMSLAITFLCFLLGYPIAYLLAILPLRSSNLIMILVLLPFWTSLLVRTASWKILLQQQGVINDLLVWIGVISDAGRLVMINNATGTIIAMTHILLPFMILPLYSVMKTIPPSYMRAAKSLGATDWTAFWRVYFPQTIPGVGAGAILVFILAIGYYITPELVGGTSGIFISNRIAYHISSSLNWGLAAALATMLLIVVLALYWTYDKIVGIDNVKLG
ncbi:ABC transporter permease [Amaricoccus macauensis]|uniref:ABC transporter permease n=1 Tax=Amaricoccus macauensis TaxID=57001 RepID=UPI003C7C782C